MYGCTDVRMHGCDGDVGVWGVGMGCWVGGTSCRGEGEGQLITSPRTICTNSVRTSFHSLRDRDTGSEGERAPPSPGSLRPRDPGVEWGGWGAHLIDQPSREEGGGSA